MLYKLEKEVRNITRKANEKLANANDNDSQSSGELKLKESPIKSYHKERHSRNISQG